MSDKSLAKFARLDAFLKKLQTDVYPEAPSGLHADLTRRMFAKLGEIFPLPPEAAVLDIGCGQGVALELFVAAGLRPTGIALGEDVAVCQAKGFDVREMDHSFLEFPDGGFDMVWCRHSLEHSIFPLFTLSEMYRVLKPGGILYVEVPAPETACRHESNRNHYSVFGKRMWTELIGRTGFTDIHIIDISFQVDAGPDVYWAFFQQRPVHLK